MDKINRNYEADIPAESSTENMEYSVPVDLTREEFITFNIAVSKINGIMRYRKGQLILFLVMEIISIASILFNSLINGTIDITSIALVLFIAVMGSLMYFGQSAYVQKTAGRAYDQNILCGNSYYGQIILYSDRLEKHREHSFTCMQFNSQIQYIETKELMIFISSDTPAIVLPARCLTQSDADAVHQVIMTKIPMSQQKLYNRIIPQAVEHITPPADQNISQEIEQMKLDVTYTQEEFIKLATDTAGLGFMRALPIYSAMSFLAALLFSYLYNFGIGAIVFILIIFGIFSLSVLSVRAKASWAYNKMTVDGTRIGISFTDRGITVKSPVSNESIGLIWESVTRAVERREFVEFYTKNTFLRIPKHCIDDFELMKQIVDRHVHPKSAAK